MTDYTNPQGVLSLNKSFIGYFLIYELAVYLANDMIIPGMPQVISDFQSESSMIPTSLTIFILGGTTLQLFIGPISDIVGRRPVMILGCLFFLLSTIFIMFSPNISYFILGRFLQGIGLCFIGTIGYVIVQEILSEMAAVRTTSIMNNIANAAPLAGPLLGAIIVEIFHWRVIFLILASLSAIALWGIIKHMPETIIYNNTSSQNLKLNFVKIYHNYRKLLISPTFLIGAVSLGFLSVPFIVWLGIAPIILIENSHLSTIEYGLWNLPFFCSVLLGSFIMRNKSRSFSLKSLIKIGAILVLTSLIVFCLIVYVAQSYIIIIIGLILYGFSLGFSGAPLIRFTLFSVDISKGTTSALMGLIGALINALGNQIISWLYFQSGMKVSIFGLACMFCGLVYFLLQFKLLIFSK
ncbi:MULTISPECIES: MFS transporter [Francisella]|uniref:Multidrug transporter MdfA n=1 Tax=Francisella opportunistica TaxID=2016517 RepID=A0A345JS91_9GAMM|nr:MULTISPECIES: MFS transporter [Francisella]APC91951.1 Multidrug translocase MdfA [Francisella sp. MA067296]AXH30187.1 MFS transporter [Francisella opportunistica]AXH31828.1 MFS transporter [Francisella opportunistica]AXH33474.1 MFS transporter [Francisella opportunistica]